MAGGFDRPYTGRGRRRTDPVLELDAWPPQGPRLLRRLMAAERCVVHVSGWPWSGLTGLAAGLAHRADRPCALYDPDDGFDPWLDAAARSAATRALWLVVPPHHAARARAALPDALPRLSPHHQVLLFDEAPAPRLPTARLERLPGALLRLNDAELGALLSAAGMTLDPPRRAALLDATDGWYGPLRWWLDHGEIDVGADAFSDPSFAAAFEPAVLDGLDEEEMEVVCALSLTERWSPRLWHERWRDDSDRREQLDEAVERWALSVDGGALLRLPRLLQAALARRRRRAWSFSETTAAHGQLARAAETVSQLPLALRHYALAADHERVMHLVDNHWDALLRDAPLPWIVAALRTLPVASEDLGLSEAHQLLTGVIRLLQDDDARAALQHLPIAMPGAPLDALGAASSLLRLLVNLDPRTGQTLPSASAASGLEAQLPPALRALATQLGRALQGETIEPLAASSSTPWVVSGANTPLAELHGWLVRASAGLRAMRAAARDLKTPAPRAPKPSAVTPATDVRAQLGRPPDAHAAQPIAIDAPASDPLSPGAAEMPAQVRYRLQLLGPPEVARVEDGGASQVLRWRLRRALHVVALLALAPDHRLPRAELVAALWPDADEATVRRNFHPTLSDARRTLQSGRRDAAPIVLEQGVYRLDPPDVWTVDVEAFVDHANRGDALARGDGRAADRSGSSAGESGNAVTGGVSDDALIAWTEAWRLYRGPLMAGYDGALIEHRRAELHRRYLDVLRSIGDAYDARGRTTEALDAYRTILIDEPYEEAVHVAVMAQYATLGRRDLVRRQYLRLTALLSELGVAPSEPTQRRYHGWMGHDPG